MKVVAVQIDTVWEDKAANHAKVRELLASADVPEGSLIVLGEMFSTGYSMNVDATEDRDGVDTNTAAFLKDLAVSYKSTVLGGVVSRHFDGKGRNEAVSFDPTGEENGRYCKLHPTSFLGELDHHVKGERTTAFPWGGASVSPFICYDLRFPEAFRMATRLGADVFAVIASWPSTRQHHWLTLNIARAIENQAYVVAVNRTGNDPSLPYAGGTRIIDFQGEILADAGDAECVISAEVDLDALRRYREDLPVLKDMRADLR